MSCSEVTHAALHRLLRTVCISPACADSETQLTKNLITKVLAYFSIVVMAFFGCIHHVVGRMEIIVVHENADFRMKICGNTFHLDF